MVFVEGQFIFKDSRIREILDMKIYIEVDDDIRLSRLSIDLFNFDF
jgi:uridine kinase